MLSVAYAIGSVFFDIVEKIWKEQGIYVRITMYIV